MSVFNRLARQLCTSVGLLSFPYVASADAYSDFSAAERAVVSSHAYHFSSSGPNINTEGDIVYPGILREKMQSGTEIIILGKAIYVRVGGTWVKNPPYAVSLRTAIKPNLILAQLSRKHYRITDLGTRKFDGAPMHAYGFTHLGHASHAWDGVAFVDKSGRLVAAVSHETIFRLSHFGEHVHVTAPRMETR